MHKVAILGSTGSIGTLALEVLNSLGVDYKVTALSTYSNVELLKEQIEKFSPEVACIGDKSCLGSSRISNTKILTGTDGLIGIASGESDIIINALVGAVGIHPTLEALKAKKRVCIANKETLVSFGEVVMATAKKYGGEILPVDSEHSAIHQCIHEDGKDVEEIILTASGGPFRKTEINRDTTPEDTLSHPIWKMGKKVTVDSATLMNKGLEVIEAVRLFGVPPNKVSVIIHPQSIIHSMVMFKDGAVLAQLSIPDMRLPIQYAITFPDRYPSMVKPLNLTEIRRLEFEPPDSAKFPCLSLAYRAIYESGTMPAVLSASDEICVENFLKRRITLPDIAMVVDRVMDGHKTIKNPHLGELKEADRWARQETQRIIDGINH